MKLYSEQRVVEMLKESESRGYPLYSGSFLEKMTFKQLDDLLNKSSSKFVLKYLPDAVKNLDYKTGQVVIYSSLLGMDVGFSTTGDANNFDLDEEAWHSAAVFLIKQFSRKV